MTSSTDARGSANVATFLTWFMPGAGHLYLGRVPFAIAAFVLIQGLYALGLFLSDGMTFEFLDPELRGPFATALTPEAGNLGGLVYQLRVYGFGPDSPRVQPDTIMLGTWLTALSGMLNVLLMIHANCTARGTAAGRSTGLVAAAWLVPGAGHWLQGRRLRALIVFAMLAGLLVAGTLMAEGSNLSRERHFYYWSGQFLAGAPAAILEFVSGRPPVTGEISNADVGLLYGCLAGLLNVLAMLDVFGFAEGVPGAEDAPSPVTPTVQPEGAES